jgi:tetratricopeptide (TPR) repeat protein
LLAGCSRQPEKAAPERIAVLRFENFSGDSSIDWQGRAFAEVLIAELHAISSLKLHGFERSLGARPVSAPGISTENTLALAAGANRLGYGEYTVRNGRLEARLTVEDSRTFKMVKMVEASGPAGDVIGVATNLARQISVNTGLPETHNPEALMLFTRAIESANAADRDRELTQAIAADPNFARAYHILAQVKLQNQDAAGARAVLQRALSLNSLSDVERARFEFEATEFGGDAGVRQAALAKLARIDPSDAAPWRALADLALNRHEYRQAMEAYQKASALMPDDVQVLNLLGYAAAQAGDLETGLAALRRYQALRPNEANPLDSIGDAYLLTGQLKEAEDFYLQAHKKDRAFLNDLDLLKAAMAPLLAGDTATAGKLADQYFEARAAAKDPTLDYRRAQWAWFAGHRKEALSRMEAAAVAAEKASWRDGASQAWTAAAIWRLMLGDRDTAAQHAQRAMTTATNATAGTALVARFASMPSATAAEWAARADQHFPQPALGGLKNYSLAYALLANGEFAAAQAVLQKIWDSGASGPDGLQVLLAWSNLEAGKVNEAAALLRTNPVLPAAGLTSYTAFYLPRLFFLRGQLADRQSRREDARIQFRKFLDLSGPDPLAWGEEAKARAAL